jgi:phosphatidylinositol glycan class A protein
MGYRVCFTDHSLFGFADASSIHMNKILKFSLSDINHVICVSNTRYPFPRLHVAYLIILLCSKENTVLRGQLDPNLVSVIPNAVDTTQFTPNPSARDPNPNKVAIVIVSRLVYRKGIDLLFGVIPVICKRFPNVSFIIGGDGPKKVGLEEMREKHQLHDQVELLGSVGHANVRNVLARGHIFLNSSLTEAFCIAMVEAASCGLHVVATRVGGVPEVLPPHLLTLAEPEEGDIIEKLTEAIVLIKSKEIDPFQVHNEVKLMYDWDNVAARTEVVYRTVHRKPNLPLLDRLQKFLGCGLYFGKINCLLAALDYLLWQFLEWLQPAADIDAAIDFPYLEYKKMQKEAKLR